MATAPMTAPPVKIAMFLTTIASWVVARVERVRGFRNKNVAPTCP